MNLCDFHESRHGDYRIRISNPLVTVLIFNSNYGRYLSEGIDSAIAQTWNNLEVIVVDDGSTDASREVLKRFDGRIRTIFKSNGGQASAFNTGIAAARGEIICFLDSDDIRHRGWLWGAGLTIRIGAWINLFKSGFRPLLSGRKGNKLVVGEDVEICYALRLAGWHRWYSDEILLFHFIPKERLTITYLIKLKFGLGSQTLGHDPYRFYVYHAPSDIKTLFGKIWLWQIAREMYISIFKDFSFLWPLRKNILKRVSSRLQLAYHAGRIFSLLKKRHKYDIQIKSFGISPWIRIKRLSANNMYHSGHPL